MDTPAHINALIDEVHALVGLVTDDVLHKTVTTCPEWTVVDLVAHVGGLHRWSTLMVDRSVTTQRWRTDFDITHPDVADDSSAVSSWLVDGLGPMTAAFSAAAPTRPVWVWGADPTVRWWPRRMLFETLTHRCDLDLTFGRTPAVDPERAADGVDEFLVNLPFTARWNDQIRTLTGDRSSLLFLAGDADRAWRIRIGSNGWWWDRPALDDPGTASVTVGGGVAEIFLLLQGRPAPAVSIDGDRAVLDRWLAATAF